MEDRAWFAALKAAWRRLSRGRKSGRVERYSIPDRLRDDIGITEHEFKSPSDWINQAMRKYPGYY
jgi:hypothetical protein